MDVPALGDMLGQVPERLPTGISIAVSEMGDRDQDNSRMAKF